MRSDADNLDPSPAPKRRRRPIVHHVSYKVPRCKVCNGARLKGYRTEYVHADGTSSRYMRCLTCGDRMTVQGE
jgi:hypothetical protein